MGKRTIAKKMFSEEEVARYKAIAEEVKASKADPASALARIEKALVGISEEVQPTEEIGGAESVMLDGCGGAVLSVGELEVSTEDVTIEEPRVVAEDDDGEDDEERSLWGDGDKDPAEEEEE